RVEAGGNSINTIAFSSRFHSCNVSCHCLRTPGCATLAVSETRATDGLSLAPDGAKKFVERTRFIFSDFRFFLGNSEPEPGREITSTRRPFLRPASASKSIHVERPSPCLADTIPHTSPPS